MTRPKEQEICGATKGASFCTLRKEHDNYGSYHFDEKTEEMWGPGDSDGQMLVSDPKRVLPGTFIGKVSTVLFMAGVILLVGLTLFAMVGGLWRMAAWAWGL